MINNKAMQHFISGLFILTFGHHYLEWKHFNGFSALNQINYIIQRQGILFVFFEKLENC